MTLSVCEKLLAASALDSMQLDSMQLGFMQLIV